MHFFTRSRRAAGLITLLLVLATVFSLFTSVPASAASYNGYRIIEWSSGETKYYTVYHNANERDGTPTFYSDPGDFYSNRYGNRQGIGSGDLKITFYRSYDGVSLAQADAFRDYLLDTTNERYCYVGYFYYGESAYPSPLFLYKIEGWDFTRFQDLQPLWDCNPLMNNDATQLELGFLNYGRLTEQGWNNAWRNGYSFAITVQSEMRDYLGYDGHTIGFRFTEGMDETVVRRYCREETSIYW